MNEENEQKKFNLKWLFLLFLIPVFMISGFGILTGVRYSKLSKVQEAAPLSSEETAVLYESLLNQFPENYANLKKIPYAFPEPVLDVKAESVILIDNATGCILYEKNADEVIPPASMTKLFAMYVVDEAVSEGLLNYDSIISLPPETWACNMPPHSSLMFLGKGHIVTLEELLLGLSVCSGNDAAYALAYAVCGNMEDFVARMNKVAEDLNLTNTHFEESSGYSENNTTTAREMAEFARVYLLRHPDSLARYHSVRSFTYPKAHNMAPGDTLRSQDWSKGFPEKITMGITQTNTNPLLDKLEGCDGLKTGYIDESGYNLSLTAERNGTRFLSITMKGPGRNAKEGQEGRIHDGTTLMEWAFRCFKDTVINELQQSYFVKCYGAEETGIELVSPDAFEELNFAGCGSLSSFCVPYVTGSTIEENLEALKIEVEVPEKLFGTIECGKQYGQIKIVLGDYVLETIPLVADRSLEKNKGLVNLADKILYKSK